MADGNERTWPVTGELVQKRVLDLARRLSREGTRTFRLEEVVALPDLNEGTVRTHLASPCCVNAAAIISTAGRTLAG